MKSKVKKDTGENQKKFDIFLFLLSFIITLGVGFIGSIFSRNAKIIYEAYKKPFFAQPAIVFPIVWTILYVLMAYALYRIWLLHKQNKDVSKAFRYYFVQLFLNFLWPVIFFYLNLSAIAFLEAVILFIFVFKTTLEFCKQDKQAGIILLPYLIWCLYALVLNFSIWFINA